MTWNRRELLGGLGVASAHALMFAFGCQRPPRLARPVDDAGEVRGWLREAVAMLAAAHPSAHALAVSRRRTTAAIDVLGAAVARGRTDGVVLVVRDRDGARRESVTSDLSRDGIRAAARALLDGGREPRSAAHVDFGAVAPGRVLADDPRALTDAALLARVAAIARRDRESTSRIVYLATTIDIDDAQVWSVAPRRDLEQRLVRVRKAATRVAWNGTRPIVAEVARAWTGGVDDQDLDAAAVSGASRAALELMTPGALDDGTYPLVLEPSVTAAVLDATVRALLTTHAVRRPEVARRLALGATLAAEGLTVIDDPRSAGAYGGFAFDDEGEPAAAVTLVERGHVVGRLADRAGVDAKHAAVAGRGLRPGHVGRVAPAPSHLRVAAGTLAADALVDDGYVLEGGLAAVVDPASDRLVVAVSRAREVKGGRVSGRVFADVELVGELGALLASIAGVASASATLGIRDEFDGEPRWRSIEAPWLRVRGTIRARRGRA